MTGSVPNVSISVCASGPDTIHSASRLLVLLREGPGAHGSCSLGSNALSSRLRRSSKRDLRLGVLKFPASIETIGARCGYKSTLGVPDSPGSACIQMRLIAPSLQETRNSDVTDDHSLPSYRTVVSSIRSNGASCAPMGFRYKGVRDLPGWTSLVTLHVALFTG